jgi:hypothetical protein
MDRQTVHDFGNQAQCNNYVKYVFFGYNVPVLGKGRVVGLTFSWLLTVVYLLVLVGERLAIYKKQRRTPASELATTSSISPTAPNNIGAVTVARSPSSPLSTSSSPQIPLSCKRSKRRRFSQLDAMMIGTYVAEFSVFVYLVTCNEKLIRHNHFAVGDTSATQWGFGQVCIATPE